MKLWHFALILLSVVITIGLLCTAIDEATGRADSVQEQAARASFLDVSEVKVVTVKGHEYIIVNGSNRGGIVHSESCPCKEGGVNNGK